VRHQPGHHALGLFQRPQLAAEVQVAAHGQAVPLRRRARVSGQLRHAVGQGRGDAGEVEPVFPLHDLVPVDFASPELGDCTALAVVEEQGRPLRCAGLYEVDAEPVAHALDVIHVQSVLAHRVDAGLAHRRVRDGRNDVALQTVVDQRDAHIGLRAGIVHLELVRLHQPLVSPGGEPHHQLAEEYRFLDVRHVRHPALLLPCDRSNPPRSSRRLS